MDIHATICKISNDDLLYNTETQCLIVLLKLALVVNQLYFNTNVLKGVVTLMLPPLC